MDKGEPCVYLRCASLGLVYDLYGIPETTAVLEISHIRNVLGDYKVWFHAAREQQKKY
jgi:hypothetical protein